MNKSYLVLRLDGVFQSYSMNRTEKYIDTSLFPTKSAIIGLLGCALGYSRGDKRLIELSDSLKMAVRMDKSPIKVSDYQTIRGGVVRVDGDGNEIVGHIAVDSLLRGKNGISSENKLITKDYLSDSKYTVILEGLNDVITLCAEALKNPVWVCSLGRHNCIPSLPIQGSKYSPLIREDLKDLDFALSNIDVLKKSKEKSYLYEKEVSFEERKDYPMGSIIEYFDNTGEYVNYNYRKRYVYRGSVTIN